MRLHHVIACALFAVAASGCPHSNEAPPPDVRARNPAARLAGTRPFLPSGRPLINPGILRRMVVGQTSPPGADTMTADALCRFIVNPMCRRCATIAGPGRTVTESADACIQAALPGCLGGLPAQGSITTPVAFRAACLGALTTLDCSGLGNTPPPVCVPPAAAIGAPTP